MPWHRAASDLPVVASDLRSAQVPEPVWDFASTQEAFSIACRKPLSYGDLEGQTALV